MPRKPKKLERGYTYRIRFARQGGNYQWSEMIMTGVYLGENHIGEPEFSLRPLAGTTALNLHDKILWVDEMPKNSEPKLPKRLGTYKPKEGE